MTNYSSLFHIKATIILFCVNVLFLSLFSAFLFILNMKLLGILLTLVTISIALSSGILYLKYNSQFVSDSSVLGLIVEKVIQNAKQPIAIYRHQVDYSGKVIPTMLFSNKAFTEKKTAPFFNEILEEDKEKLNNALLNGESAVARIIDKDEHDRFFETELNVTPVTLNGKLSYWLGHKTFIQYLDSNVIPLIKQKELKLPTE